MTQGAAVEIDFSGFGNNILYEMCRNNPAHNAVDVVSGKLFIIGRVYAAAIERKAGLLFSLDRCAKCLVESDIDSEIEKLRSSGPVTAANAHILLATHKKLMNVFETHTGIQKRSLASKYLHFHAPESVFIFDSLASGKLKEKVKLRFETDLSPDSFDPAYRDFVMACLVYKREVIEHRLGCNVSPRMVDMYLSPYGKAYLNASNLWFNDTEHYKLPIR